ncbi:RloB family protein [Caulobacter sp. ErkDOM-E]|uniref:RloB family protein n=1 Tax=Caulobacter sp. ErkDOM-E TaxID=3402778 RepID=UPI003AF4A28C
MPRKTFTTPSLGRKAAVRDTFARLLILCEGKNTEPRYFEEFIEEHGSRLLSVEVFGAQGAPKTMVDEARRRIKEMRSDRKNYSPNDKVWVVFDCDEHPRRKEALEEARVHGIGVAYSDPCFELWGILHLQEFDAPLDRHKMQSSFEKVAPNYDKKKGKEISYRELKDGYADACIRSKRLRERRQQDGGQTPYTDVDLLTEFIIANSKAP